MYATYNTLLKAGWRMQEIDGMDMLGFLKVRAWDVRQSDKDAQPRAAYIDEVWREMKTVAR